VFDPVYQGRSLDTLFSTRDPVQHKKLRASVAGRFSNSGIRRFEPAILEAIDRFSAAITSDLNQVPDLKHLLDCLAFDIATATTFGKSWGALVKPEDVRPMFKGLKIGFKYGAVIGQIPSLHPWLLGSPTLLATLNFIGVADPVSPLFVVSCTILDQKRLLLTSKVH
jgi:hypothetical protein